MPVYPLRPLVTRCPKPQWFATFAVSISSQNLGFCWSASSSCIFKPERKKKSFKVCRFRMRWITSPSSCRSKYTPVIPDPESVQCSPVAFEFPERIEFGLENLLRQPAEIPKDLQLQFLWHPRQLRRASRVKNDLKRAHRQPRVERRESSKFRSCGSSKACFRFRHFKASV